MNNSTIVGGGGTTIEGVSSLLKIAPLGAGLPPGGAAIKSATPRFPDRGDGVEKFR